MGVLVDGVWHDHWHDTRATGGRFMRRESQFRSWVTPDGAPGLTGEGGFRAERGRYHLYVSAACPWAHRTVIFRRLKGLEDAIGISVVHWLAGRTGGRSIRPGRGPGHGERRAVSVRGLREGESGLLGPRHRPGPVGQGARPDREQRVVRDHPDVQLGVRRRGRCGGRLLPAELRDDIDAVNDRVYSTVNNGVYRCGFATSQAAYDEAVGPLFETWIGWKHGWRRAGYVCGERVTEADWRLFTTLVRFDVVYHYHFKCNVRRLTDYPNLWAYTRDLYQQPGIAATVDFEHIKRHYYKSHLQ